MAGMNATSSKNEETYTGRLLAFTIPARHARGRLVRLDDVLDEILAAHDYPAPVTHLLAEALVLAVLIGGLVKDDGSQVTMQAQTEAGAVSLLVCDYKGGELRGYVEFDEGKLAELGANPSLFALFGKGYLAITFDLVGGQGRYQGIVPLEGDSLAEACERYFYQSEQVPTLIRCAVRSDGAGVKAAGLLVQHLPEGEEGASGFMPSWIIPNGNMSQFSLDRYGTKNCSIPNFRLKPSPGGCSTKKIKFSFSPGPRSVADAGARSNITRMFWSAFPKTSAPRCAMKTGSSS